jgi:hypothetical protein
MRASSRPTTYLKGVFVNEGQSYPAGTERTVKPSHPHGPHLTSTGVTFLAMFTGNVYLNDFHLST